MDIEDEIIRDFQTMERIIEDKKKEVEERTKEVEKKKKEVEARDKTIINTVIEFSKLGLSVEKIAEITKLSLQEISELLKSK